MRVVNLAHGDFVVLSALICAWSYAHWATNPIALLPVTIALGFVAGALVHRFLLRRLPTELASSEASSLTLTFGLSYFLAGAGLAVFGGEFRSVPVLTGAFQLGPISIAHARLLAFVAAFVLAGALGALMRYTALGRAIRATSQNPDGALACGVDADRVKTLSFALGSAVAAAAGNLLAMIYTLSPQEGVGFTIGAFAVVAIGGLGNYSGAIVGALLLGCATSFSSFFAGTKLAEAAPYVAFVVVLLLLPNGIMGRRTA
jgi:branched-chain amino acid transport system permease protein